MEEGLLYIEVAVDTLLLYQDVRGVYDLVLETHPASREYFLDGL